VNNRTIIDKIKETNEWLDERLNTMEVFKNQPKQQETPKEE
jgi:hypothetical protein